MERGRLSPRTCTPSPGQCSMCQRHLWQWRADGGLAHQRPDISRTTDARTGHAYAWGTQRQRWPSCDLRSNMIARATLLAQATNGPSHAFSHALPVLLTEEYDNC